MWLSVASCWTVVHLRAAVSVAGMVPAQAATNGKKANAIQDLDMKNPSASDRSFQQQGRRLARIVSTKGGFGSAGSML
jgi:hypothetical protein